MRLRSLLFGLSALVVTAASAAQTQAAVVYNWVSTSGNISGNMTISDAVYASGGMDFNIFLTGDAISCATAAPCSDAAGLVSVNVYSLTGPGVTLGGSGQMQFALDIAGDLLSGSMAANKPDAHFNMSGSGMAWTAVFGNDFGSCTSDCNGTGYWQLASGGPPTSGVPEPFSAALFGLALGVVALRRRIHAK